MKYDTDGHEVDADFTIIVDMLYDKGLFNSSWRNDLCPSFTNDEIVVFVDRKNVEDRESSEFSRYSITSSDGIKCILDTDDFDAVISTLDRYKSK
jgi:hypothetical protein